MDLHLLFQEFFQKFSYKSSLLAIIVYNSLPEHIHIPLRELELVHDLSYYIKTNNPHSILHSLVT